MNSEELIIKVMKDNNCHGQDNMIVPADLIKKCQKSDGRDPKSLESALISLIDQDVVEYEMDDNLVTTQLWLL